MSDMSDAEPARGRVSFWGPNAVTVARFPIALALLAVAVAADPPARVAMVALVVTGVVTDVADGWWARSSGRASTRGARLDSAADAALGASLAVALVVSTRPPTSGWWWGIGAIAAMRVGALAVTAARFRLLSVAHTWANKAAGLAIGAAAVIALASGRLDGWATGVACVVAGAAAVDELALVCVAHTYDRDVRGVWDRARPQATPTNTLGVPKRCVR